MRALLYVVTTVVAILAFGLVIGWLGIVYDVPVEYTSVFTALVGVVAGSIAMTRYMAGGSR